MKRFTASQHTVVYMPTALGETPSEGTRPDLLVRVVDLKLARPGSPAAPPLLEAARLDVHAGDRLGLVGHSGAGKTTLLRTIAGEIEPAAGRALRLPGVKVAYLSQAHAATPGATVSDVASAALTNVRAAEARMRAAEVGISAGEPGGAAAYAAAEAEHERLGGYGAESVVREVLHALGFDEPTWAEQADALSAGQRRRLALASVLASPADLLLLDEPTNHLDIQARAWLERYLVGRGRACVIVSHDRALLAAATTATLFLSGGRLEIVRAGYDRASKRVEVRDAARRRRAAEMRRESERLERVAAELAREGRRARARERSAAELSRRASELAEGFTQAGNVELGDANSHRQSRRGRTGWLLDAQDLASGALFSDVDVRIAPGDRIALLGRNGSGKSTLLRILAGELPPGGPLVRLEYAPGMRLEIGRAHV